MKALSAKAINVIIETPRNSRNKYTYDEQLKAFKLKKILPAGAAFPYDFGFIPGTKAEDGDPLDVLVIMDEPAYPGCVIECRILGALKAGQSKENKWLENDRLIAVPVVSHTHNNLREIEDFNENVLKEIEHFFTSYISYEGEHFQAKGWANATEALQLIEQAKTEKSG